MMPTMKLRIAMRLCQQNPVTGECFLYPTKYPILQQWWSQVSSSGVEISGEWRDVEVEEES